MLALVGSGEYLPPMEMVDRYLLDQIEAGPHVVCLPTAAGTEGPERVAYWSRLGVAHFTRLGAQVEALPVIDQASANDPQMADRLRQANFVYLSGGKPAYLFRSLEGSLVWDAVLEVYALGGVVAGCSAGAMILGERIPSFPRSQHAFSLLPGTQIMPHFDELPDPIIRLLRLLTPRHLTLVGIEGNTALVCSDDHYQVIGRGGVTTWNRRGKVRFTHGQAHALS